jgi:hypothetical protein
MIRMVSFKRKNLKQIACKIFLQNVMYCNMIAPTIYEL